jgi:hypothetical protein
MARNLQLGYNMSIIGPIVGAVRAARAAQVAARVVGGIKGAKTVGQVYKEGSASPINPTIAESKALIEKTFNIPAKGTPQRAAYDASLQRKAETALSKNRIKRGN